MYIKYFCLVLGELFYEVFNWGIMFIYIFNKDGVIICILKYVLWWLWFLWWKCDNNVLKIDKIE